MNDLKIGDRVRIISDPKFIEFTGERSIIGMTGTVKDLNETCAGVEFDVYMGGHNESWRGKNGYCWYMPYERLEKIEETEDETEEETKEEVNEGKKTEMLEQKILKVLRAEIGVDIGEEFDVYDNGEKQWTCKFDKNGFFHVINDEFYKSGVWKDIVYNFCRYTFKRKPFVPQDGEKYWHFEIRGSLNGNKSLDILENVWDSLLFDYGMLALGNVFRNREEAIKGEDKLLERLNELLKGEWIWKSCCKS